MVDQRTKKALDSKKMHSIIMKNQKERAMFPNQVRLHSFNPKALHNVLFYRRNP
jgi:hypothetical protein